MNGLYSVRPGHAADLRPDVFPKALQEQTRGAKPPSYPPHVPFLFPSAANRAVDVQLYGYRWISLKKRPDRPVGRWHCCVAANVSFFSGDSQSIIFAGLYHILPGMASFCAGSPVHVEHSEFALQAVYR